MVLDSYPYIYIYVCVCVYVVLNVVVEQVISHREVGYYLVAHLLYQVSPNCGCVYFWLCRQEDHETLEKSLGKNSGIVGKNEESQANLIFSTAPCPYRAKEHFHE